MRLAAARPPSSPDEPGKEGSATQGGDIGGRVAGATGDDLGRVVFQDEDRRLREMRDTSP